LIIVLTENGETARLVSKYKPSQLILACSIDSAVIRQLNVTSGVIGFKIPSFQGTENLLKSCINAAKDQKLCKKGNKVICVHSTKEEEPGISNLLKILDIE
jgi:pyruvate kinase